MYVQNVPMKMSEGLPAFAKQCIHLEIRESDKELFQALFNYILLSKADKKLLGQFARFYYGAGAGSSITERNDLGGMLQNHVAVIRSMGKVALPGIVHPDKIMKCMRANDADDIPQKTVHLSLRQILMKQKIGPVRVWQCILPNSAGGWDGFYANGFGCEEHRQKALLWAVCVAAHTRFYLLSRGVLVESVKDFINQVFSPDAATEAFSARKINGQVYTQGAVSALRLRQDIETSGWIDVSLGQFNTASDSKDVLLSRPKIAPRENGDLSAHDFMLDRNPEIIDTHSIAYSTAGDTTLGDSIYEDPEGVQDVEAVKRDDQSLSTFDGSTESQLWNGKDSRGASDAYNTEEIINNMEVITQPEISTDTSTNHSSHADQLAELIKQIEKLRATNAELQAAAASSNAVQILESHPTQPQSEREDSIGSGDGGNH